MKGSLIEIPNDCLQTMLPMLDETSQCQYALTCRESQKLFKNQVSANQLLRLLSTYEIKGEIRSGLIQPLYYALEAEGKNVFFTTYYHGQLKPVQNPILLIAYSVLKNNPELLVTKGLVTDSLGCTFENCSPLELIFKSGNFMLKELILQLIPEGEEKIAVAEQVYPIKYDLKRYINAVLAFLTEFPAGMVMRSKQWHQIMNQLMQVIQPELLCMPAWLGHALCSPTALDHSHHFYDVILSARNKELKLLSGQSFFSGALESDLIHKRKLENAPNNAHYYSVEHGGSGRFREGSSIGIESFTLLADLVTMMDLDATIKEKFKNPQEICAHLLLNKL